ncbi:MAG: response regulator [Alphaproteobacteria bacterium]|nr:response regulator [Alphaproteobacteria bacterium]
MKVVTKISILLLIFTIISFVLIWLQYDSQTKMIGQYFDNARDQKERMIHSLIRAQSEYYKILTLDYTYGDDMIDFAASPDPAWAGINLRVIIDLYHASSVWIYNKEGIAVYSTTSEAINRISPDRILPDAVRSILEREKFIRYFMKTSAGLLEIHGATIHGTQDKNRLSSPNGFVFIGKLWDRSYLKTLETGTDCNLSVNYHKPYETSFSNTQIFIIPIKNQWERNPLAFLKVAIDFGPLTVIRDRFDRQFYLYGAVILVWVLVLGFFLIRWIVVPLRKVSLLLESQNLSIGQGFRPSPNEFREVTAMINDFIDQKNALQSSEEKLRKITEAANAAKNKAEQSDRLKAAFLANMSHEIRTPMNSILGFSELIRKEQISKGEIEEYADIISYSTKRLLRMIDDIIEISKIETGQVDLNETAFRTDDLFQELYEYYRREIESAGKQGIVLHLMLPDEGMQVRIVTDRAKVKQVLVNLLDNALKFTQKGTINFGCSRPRDGFCEFFVTDTGIGIAAADQDKIFETFRQIDYSNARHYSGTGMGLSISRSLVELMGGRIWVESVPGEGSTFHFTLPVTLKEMDLPATEKPLIRNDFTGLTVLVVEDEIINARLLGMILQKANVNVLFARNGMTALEMLEQHPETGLVLMDIQMPGMDGFECTRHIRRRWPGIPVVAQSASAYQEESKICLESGCVDHLTKPIDASVLYRVIHRYWKRNQSQNS